MKSERSYQRAHLRAPYKEEILYVDGKYVFKARAMNISEGGLLLDQVPHFPEKLDGVPFMIALPQYPYFKNFSLSRLKSFDDEVFQKKIIRFKAKMVRKVGVKSAVDEIMSSRIGLAMTEVQSIALQSISQYVDVYSSNLIYLQVLIDSLNTHPENLEKVRQLSRILHYDSELKISMLSKIISRDYQSLQWL